MESDTPPIPPADPYATPLAELAGAAAVTAPGTVSEGTIRVLHESRPWVLVVATVFMLAACPALFRAFTMGIHGAGRWSMPFALRFAGYTAVGFSILVSGRIMFRYSTAVRRLVISRSARDLERALTVQRNVWKCVGVLAVLYVAMTAFVLVEMEWNSGLEADHSLPVD